MRQLAIIIFVSATACTYASSTNSGLGNALPERKAEQAQLGPAEERKLVVRRYIEVWQNGSLEELSELIADGYVGHPASGDRDIDGLRRRIAQFRAAYPDMRFTIEDQLSVGNRVATRMTATGIATATGKPVRLIGINISRFMGNRIVEEWPVWEVALPRD